MKKMLDRRDIPIQGSKNVMDFPMVLNWNNAFDLLAPLSNIYLFNSIHDFTKSFEHIDAVSRAVIAQSRDCDLVVLFNIEIDIIQL